MNPYNHSDTYIAVSKKIHPSFGEFMRCKITYSVTIEQVEAALAEVERLCMEVKNSIPDFDNLKYIRISNIDVDAVLTFEQAMTNLWEGYDTARGNNSRLNENELRFHIYKYTASTLKNVLTVVQSPDIPDATFI